MLAIFNVLFYLLTISLCVCGKFALSKSIDILWWLLQDLTRGKASGCDHQQYTTGWIVQGRAVGAIRKEAKMFSVKNYQKIKSYIQIVPGALQYPCGMGMEV